MADFIGVAKDGCTFEERGTGRRFVPMGCNYFDPKTGWAPKIWARYDHDRVSRHLGQMAEAGLNCIRVFLDMGILNPRPNEFSDDGFGKVDDMVAVAAKAGIRIIFSGPNTWHGVPDHRRGDPYADPEQMACACLLWQKIVERWGAQPTVMAWDLFNEPMVGWPTGGRARRLEQWQAFAKARGIEAPGGLLPADTKGQDPAIWAAYLDFQQHLAEQWVARQCEAIRGAGARQMITVGLIQWGIPILLPGNLGLSAFRPGRIARHLDYLSAHFYPMLRRGRLQDELDLQRAYLEVVMRATRVPGKPLVMEEFGWKGGKAPPGDREAMPEEHQSLWGDALMEVTGRAGVCGWLNWGYADAADPKADISAASGLWTEDEELKHWGRRFAQHAARLTRQLPPYRAADKCIEVNTVEFLFAHGGHPQLDWLEGRMAEHPGQSIEVAFT